MEEADTTAQERIWIEGRREGIAQAKPEMLKRQITETFGPLPALPRGSQRLIEKSFGGLLSPFARRTNVEIRLDR